MNKKLNMLKLQIQLDKICRCIVTYPYKILNKIIVLAAKNVIYFENEISMSKK